MSPDCRTFGSSLGERSTCLFLLTQMQRKEQNDHLRQYWQIFSWHMKLIRLQGLYSIRKCDAIIHGTLHWRSFRAEKKVMLLLASLMSIRLMPSDECTQFTHSKPMLLSSLAFDKHYMSYILRFPAYCGWCAVHPFSRAFPTFEFA